MAIISLGTPDHIGYVVKDLEGVRGFLSSTFGVGPWETFEYWTTKEDMIVGEPFGLKNAIGNAGETKIELLQPLTENSIWAQALEAAGESAHHMAFVVPDWEKVMKQAEAEPWQVLVSASFQGIIRWSYIDFGKGGIIMEFMEPFPES
jgi:hypothetical protein